MNAKEFSVGHYTRHVQKSFFQKKKQTPGRFHLFGKILNADPIRKSELIFVISTPKNRIIPVFERIPVHYFFEQVRWMYTRRLRAEYLCTILTVKSVISFFTKFKSFVEKISGSLF